MVVFVYQLCTIEGHVTMRGKFSRFVPFQHMRPRSLLYVVDISEIRELSCQECLNNINS